MVDPPAPQAPFFMEGMVCKSPQAQALALVSPAPQVVVLAHLALSPSAPPPTQAQVTQALVGPALATLA